MLRASYLIGALWIFGFVVIGLPKETQEEIQGWAVNLSLILKLRKAFAFFKHLLRKYNLYIKILPDFTDESKKLNLEESVEENRASQRCYGDHTRCPKGEYCGMKFGWVRYYCITGYADGKKCTRVVGKRSKCYNKCTYRGDGKNK